MPNRQYTQTESRGLVVETRTGSTAQAVEIYDKASGNIVDASEDVTDLRNPRDLADSGEKIFVYPGEYQGQDLLRDGVDWDFADGAVVENIPSDTGAIFGNTGVHSIGDQITSEVKGKGVFKLPAPGASSGFSIVNVLKNGSDISIEAKEFRVDDDVDYSTNAPVFIFAGAGFLNVNVDQVYYNPGDVTGGFARFVSNTTSSISASDSEDAEIDVNVGDLDYSDATNYLGIYGADSDEEFRGNTRLDIKKLRTSENNTFSTFFTRVSETKGHVEINVRDHVEGEIAFGFEYTSGTKPVFLNDFNLNLADGGSGIASRISSPTLYLNNVTVDGTDGGDLIIGLDNSEPTIDLVGDVAITGGSNSVIGNVTFNGSNIESL